MQATAEEAGERLWYQLPFRCLLDPGLPAFFELH